MICDHSENAFNTEVTQRFTGINDPTMSIITKHYIYYMMKEFFILNYSKYSVMFKQLIEKKLLFSYQQ